MSLIPRNSLFDLDNLFNGSWSPFDNYSNHNNGKLGTFAPRVDVKEKDSAYEISVELPGVDKKDVQVALQNGVLTIEAETRQENKEEKDGKVIRQERRYGKFFRSFDLGTQVHEKDVTANFNNGILTLVAPKTNRETNTARRIEIS